MSTNRVVFREIEEMKKEERKEKMGKEMKELALREKQKPKDSV